MSRTNPDCQESSEKGDFLSMNQLEKLLKRREKNKIIKRRENPADSNKHQLLLISISFNWAPWLDFKHHSFPTKFLGRVTFCHFAIIDIFPNSEKVNSLLTSRREKKLTPSHLYVTSKLHLYLHFLPWSSTYSPLFFLPELLPFLSISPCEGKMVDTDCLA